MHYESAIEKLNAAAPASFHVLDDAKSKRMKAQTMYIPSPADVANAIRAIPHGSTRTIAEIRKALAVRANADTTCPAAINKFWKLLAFVSEPMAYSNAYPAIPWWRVLKGGKPSRHMPGGVEEQIVRLRAEGVVLKHHGSGR